jgi:hypothetical protein
VSSLLDVLPPWVHLACDTIKGTFNYAKLMPALCPGTSINPWKMALLQMAEINIFFFSE